MPSNVTTYLVAYDFSPDADEALAVAVRDLHAGGGGRVVLCHICTGETDEPRFAWSSDLPLPEAPQDRILMAERASRRLAQVASRCQKPEVSIEVRTRVGHPSREILRMAEDVGASRIIMGSEGHVDVMRVLLGHVAREVAQKAPVPVMLVKSRSATAAAHP